MREAPCGLRTALCANARKPSCAFVHVRTTHAAPSSEYLDKVVIHSLAKKAVARKLHAVVYPLPWNLFLTVRSDSDNWPVALARRKWARASNRVQLNHLQLCITLGLRGLCRRMLLVDCNVADPRALCGRDDKLRALSGRDMSREVYASPARSARVVDVWSRGEVRTEGVEGWGGEGRRGEGVAATSGSRRLNGRY